MKLTPNISDHRLPPSLAAPGTSGATQVSQRHAIYRSGKQPPVDGNSSKLTQATQSLATSRQATATALAAKGLPVQSPRSHNFSRAADLHRGEAASPHRSFEAHHHLGHPPSPPARSRANAVSNGRAQEFTQRLKEALSQIEGEVKAISLQGEPMKVAGTFLRIDSPGQKLLKELLSPGFTEPSKQLMSAVLDSLESSLNQPGEALTTKEIDHAFAKAFTTMIDKFTSITFPPNYLEAANKIADSIDASAAEHSRGQSEEKNQVLQETVKAMKQNIHPALLLRVFMPQLTLLSLASNENFGARVKQLDTRFQSNQDCQDINFTMRRFPALLTSRINSAGDVKLNHLDANFPELLQAVKSADLSGLLAFTPTTATTS